MKRIVLLCMLSLFFLVGCQDEGQQSSENKKDEFYISDMSVGLGSVDGEMTTTRCQYEINITSESLSIDNIESVEIIYSDEVQEALEKVEYGELTYAESYVTLEGKVYFSTEGKSKMEIDEMNPYITEIVLTLEGGTTQEIKIERT